MLPTVEFANPGARGCGSSRDEGAVYLEVGTSPFGSPLEEFLFDPVIRFDPDEWGLSLLQPLLIETSPGHYDVFDWIGQTHYPNIADYIEEVREMGISRKCELSDDAYAKLDPSSRIFVVMADAWIEPEVLAQVPSYLSMQEVGYPWEVCPTGKHDRSSIKAETCAGWHWHRVDHKSKPHPEFPDSLYVTRQMPSFEYAGAKSWDCFLEADKSAFQPGMIMALQISRFAVVQDTVANTHEDKLKKLAGCSLRYDLVEE